MRLPAALLAAALVLAAAPGPLRAATPAEIVFWTSAAQDNTVESYGAYLQAFPNGTFASLAQRRIAGLSGAAAPPRAGAPAGPEAPAAASVWVRPAKGSVRLVDGVAVELDASALRRDGNWRVGIVPAAWPDGPPPDRDWFLANTVGVPPTLYRVTVPAGPAGKDEVRLYWIPRFESDYRVAARAPITVQPGVAGAVLMRDLASEAEALGPLRFEAAHRDKPILVQAAFLRVRPQTEWNYAWFRGTLLGLAVPAAIVSVGQVGALPDSYGSKREGLCLLDASGPRLDRIANLKLGDPVLLRAVPTSWSSADAVSPVLLKSCELLPNR